MDAFQGLEPTYSRDGEYHVVDRWVVHVEKLLRCHNCVEDQKVRYATFMFKGDPKDWWQDKCRELLDGSQGLAWAKFLRIFYGQFFPLSAREKRAEEFAYLMQGKLSVAEYEAKFRSLSKFAPWIDIDPMEKGRKFQRGLRQPIRS